jgi:DNA polymerase sigma
VEPLGLQVELIGSFATGLWTHYSDIDIALVTLCETYVDFDKLIEKVYRSIRSNLLKLNIKQISFNKASKIQSIKIDLDPILFGCRKVDIMIFHKKNSAKVYVNYITEALFAYKQIRPLFFTLKRICEEFGLHDPFNGGLKSYSIFLMIYSLVARM